MKAKITELLKAVADERERNAQRRKGIRVVRASRPLREPKICFVCERPISVKSCSRPFGEPFKTFVK